jgi:hypothetical protein
MPEKSPRHIRAHSYEVEKKPYVFNCRHCGIMQSVEIWPGKYPTVCDKEECKQKETKEKVAAKRKKDIDVPYEIATILKNGGILPNGSPINEEYIHLHYHVNRETAKRYLIRARVLAMSKES